MVERLTERRIQTQLYWKYRPSAAAIMPNYTPAWWYESDLFVVLRSMYSIEFEIKLSVADFRADRRKWHKHQRLEKRDGRLPTRFIYVTPVNLIGHVDLPPYAGWFTCSEHGALRIKRHAPRLSTERHVPETVTQMWRAASFRFWHERFRFDEYKRTAADA